MKKLRGNIGQYRVELTEMGGNDLRTEMAMRFTAALISDTNYTAMPAETATLAVKYADALIQRLKEL